ncbi:MULTISPECIES: DUF6446 family protein [Halocynthiibacter]|uniref:DUF6446 family protein n=1 Tax=Halocynthiibacter halioticoli TaxID=2986804 RepID=A0AAE3IY32_9RHOB|nr:MULTISPECIES: DUF6446 family protein [Halocynthiibacter]MCV6823864.1 DUF6446 family protein [Halocynthiibacter halioticoli]MCW4056865.1 DUF6446 family protein [Halocynthiibacter sp. SDUM655004]
MIGKLLAGVIVISALAAGAAMYYFQVYGFYTEVEASSPDAEIRITNIVTGEPEPMLIAGFEGIDSDSSPIRFRACFTTPMSNAMMTETFKGYPAAEPLVAPDWFSCFDAKALGTAIKAGTATAYLGEENIIYGIDRVIAVYDDGRAYAWHQINTCGEYAFNGDPLPASCPPNPSE